jgi:Flp pilus assembly protein TadD
VVPYRRAISIDPLEADNYVLLGEAYYKAGQYERAVEARRQALAQRPDDVRLMMSLGVAYGRAGMLEEAVTVLHRAAELRPRDGVIAGNLGSVYLTQGDGIEAERYLRLAVRLDRENSPQWQANMARAMLLQGRRTEALEQARAAARVAPDNAYVRDVLRQIEEGER